MHFSRNRRRHDNEEAILPLTNVVFLLLIFFMLAGRLTSAQPFEIAPPQSQSEAPARGAGVEVQIGAGGALALDGETTDMKALEAAVRKRIEGKGQTRVRVRADGAGDATRVVAVMHVLHDAGVEQLRLITVTPSN